MYASLAPVFKKLQDAHAQVTFVTGRHWAPGELVEKHWHREHYQLDLFEGLGSVTLGDRSVNMAGATLVFIPPRTHHAFTASRHGQLRNLGIKFIMDSPALSAVPAFALPQLSDSQTHRIEDALRQVLEEWDANTIDSQLAITGRLLAMLVEVLRVWVQQQRDTTALGAVQNASRFMAVRYSELLSIREVAQHCGVRPDSLSRAFRQHLSLSPQAYLLRLRLRHACTLLAAGASVTHAAERTGFSSVHYFSRAFHKTMGQSPSNWRYHAKIESPNVPDIQTAEPVAPLPVEPIKPPAGNRPAKPRPKPRR